MVTGVLFGRIMAHIPWFGSEIRNLTLVSSLDKQDFTYNSDLIVTDQ